MMNYLNAQNSYNYLPQVYPKSPEAFQLYKYEKIPVSEYSGCLLYTSRCV